MKKLGRCFYCGALEGCSYYNKKIACSKCFEELKRKAFNKNKRRLRNRQQEKYNFVYSKTLKGSYK